MYALDPNVIVAHACVCPLGSDSALVSFLVDAWLTLGCQLAERLHFIDSSSISCCVHVTQLISGGDISSMFSAEERVEIADMVIDDALSESYNNIVFSPMTRSTSQEFSKLDRARCRDCVSVVTVTTWCGGYSMPLLRHSEER